MEEGGLHLKCGAVPQGGCLAWTFMLCGHFGIRASSFALRSRKCRGYVTRNYLVLAAMLIASLKLFFRLLRQTDAPHEVDEALVGSKTVKSRIHLEADQVHLTLRVGYVEPLERRISLSQR